MGRMASTVLEALDVREAWRARLKHLRDEQGDPELAICGARLKGEPASPGSDPCMVCLDLARPGWLTR